VAKASDMLIARRADTQARADFATWQMMAKLNGMSELSDQARDSLARHAALREKMDEREATEQTVQMIYAAYFQAMGGAGSPPPAETIVKEREAPAFTNNVMPMKRPTPAPKPASAREPDPKRELPVRSIFVCLVLIAVAFHYLWR